MKYYLTGHYGSTKLPVSPQVVLLLSVVYSSINRNKVILTYVLLYLSRQCIPANKTKGAHDQDYIMERMGELELGKKTY